MINWPDDKKFAFTIFDDTDGSTVSNIQAVYQLLQKSGLKTTKSIWTYPSRDHFSGDCLQDTEYNTFVQKLKKQGFEIASHGAGSGKFLRDEIISSLDFFCQTFGHYPVLHANHSQNIDNIHWGHKRFAAPLSWAYKIKQKRIYEGEDKLSPHYWGDYSKKYIKYIRNRTFNNINTLKVDPYMPYSEPQKSESSNFWFSSSDAHTVKEFCHLLSPENIDQLEKEGGLCIVYTHFAAGFYDEKTGCLNSQFVDCIKNISSRPGWFMPTGEILDFLMKQKGRGKALSKTKALRLDMNWIFDRLQKRLRFGI